MAYEIWKYGIWPVESTAKFLPDCLNTVKPAGLFLLFRFGRRSGLLHRTARGLPGVNTAEQRAGVFESLLLHQERRTGARVFGRSATVGDDELIFRQIFEVASLQLTQRDIGRAFDV